jgi:NAD(P)H-hydrate epimerase
MPYPRFEEPLPELNSQQMREVDRLMVEQYEIELIQMMENAGRSLANLARARFFDGDPGGRSLAVIAGTGGNGGGALAAARHLANRGATVSIVVSRAERYLSKAALHQLEILKRMGLPVSEVGRTPALGQVELILDGVIGYSLKGVPRGPAAAMIRWANAHPAPVLALDVPSGVDVSTGSAYDPAIRATATMTLALPKKGLLAQDLAQQVGELYLADIGVPPGLYSRLGIEIGPIFARAGILRLR